MATKIYVVKFPTGPDYGFDTRYDRAVFAKYLDSVGQEYTYDYEEE